MTSHVSAVDSARNDVDAVIDLARRAAVAYGRSDLLSRIERLRLAREGSVRIVVAGEFKAGKSSLVNALVSRPVCPVDDDTATAVPTIVRHASTSQAAVLRVGPDAIRRDTLPLEEVPGAVTRPPVLDAGVLAVEIGLPARELANGLVFVDTPGVGGVVASHRLGTLAMVDDADAVLMCSDASSALTAPEVELLKEIARRCAEITLVVTKVDAYPAWRRIVETNREHLAAAGIDAEIVAVSAMLRTRAVELGDAMLHGESGFGALAEHLRRSVLDGAESVRDRRAVSAVGGVVDAMSDAFVLERVALADRGARAELDQALQASIARNEAALERSARWQVQLNDGMKDLINNVEFDLRRSFRELTEAAAERIDTIDPRKEWDSVRGWLEAEVAGAVLANQRLLFDEVDALTLSIERLFDAEGHDPRAPRFDPDRGDEPGSGARLDVELDRAGVLRSVLGGLRGSYSGLLMFGALGGVAGVAIATPVLVGIGVMLGARQVGDERERQLKGHRQQSLQAAKRYIDSVSFVVNKSVRDHTNAAQRMLRDHYTQRALDLREDNTAALASLRASTADRDARRRRREDLGAELERLRALRRRVDAADQLLSAEMTPAPNASKVSTAAKSVSHT